MIGIGGLGATYKIGSSGQVIDCDLWSNITESVCWVPNWLGGASQQELPQKAVQDPVTGQTTYEPVVPADVNPDTPSSPSSLLSFVPLIVLGVGAVVVLDIVRGR